jgi:hypothetical protein
MKKMFLTLALVVSMVGVANAQANGQSIGLRLGYPGEISYQTGLGKANRLELGLGLRSYTGYSTFSVSGVYQWVWDLSSLADGFNWYLGVGAQAGYYSYLGANGLPLSVLGQVGIEYNFNIPIRLSLDYRPAFQLTNGSAFVGDGIALGVRYRF